MQDDEYDPQVVLSSCDKGIISKDTARKLIYQFTPEENDMEVDKIKIDSSID